MKKDIGIFAGYHLGLVIGVIGALLGLFILFANTWLGLAIIIISIFIGKFNCFS